MLHESAYGHKQSVIVACQFAEHQSLKGTAAGTGRFRADHCLDVLNFDALPVPNHGWTG
jgi:hypothetical protein